MKGRLLAIALPVLVAFASITTPANAAVISFTSTDLLRSTVEGFQEITAPSGVPASSMPADSTFTLPFDGVAPAVFSGVWYRFNFNLPTNITALSMNVHLSIDNEIQLFLNDQNAAVEDDTVVENFNGAPFPQFTLNSNGTVTNNSGTWDNLPITQAMFLPGPNELTFFATNNGGLGLFVLFDGASISFTETEPTPIGVPEPGTLTLLTLGLIGAGLARRRAA